MEAKEKKKRDEIEAKEERKKEREKKKRQKEEEMKVKAAEREKKIAERAKKAAEKAAEKEQKAAERKQKAEEKKKLLLEKEAEKRRKAALHPKRPGVRLRQPSNKENVGGGINSNTPSSSHSKSTTPTSESNNDQSECSVCLGRYSDDFVDGILQKEWVRCTNVEKCGLWMHCDCLSMEKNEYVCYMCGVIFK